MENILFSGTSRFLEIYHQVQSELSLCLNFWLDFGLDQEYGGIYTCLDRKGSIYSTDKSVWMQGRCAWTYSYLSHIYGVKDQWLEMSRSCLDFMEKYCMNEHLGNRFYFTVTKEGLPLRQRRYCFSEGFYTIANAEYFGVTGDLDSLERSRRVYDVIYNLNHGLMEDPVGLGSKVISETRSTRALADPMIYLNITQILRRVDQERLTFYNERAKECVYDILEYHYKPDLGYTLESVALDGSPEFEYTSGRVLNPGHVIECAWFLMEEADFQKDEVLFQTACTMFLQAFEKGWDEEYGGLFYFQDCLDLPTESYEHDMKLWWPHNEILIASLKAFCHTRKQVYWDCFEKTFDYCMENFRDSEYGEWYGYLRRDGKPTEPIKKGSTFKGPFHLPRMLIMVEQMLKELMEEQKI